jgi:hypothetical protein
MTSPDAGEQLHKMTSVTEEHWRRAEPTFQQTSDEVRNDGLLPIWDFQSCALVWQPELTFLHIGVYKTRRGRLGRASRTLLAYEVIPVWCLRQGYRSVPLRAPAGGNYIKDCALLVYVSSKLCTFDTAESAGPPPPPPPQPLIGEKGGPKPLRPRGSQSSVLPPIRPAPAGARSDATLLQSDGDEASSTASPPGPTGRSTGGRGDLPSGTI